MTILISRAMGALRAPEDPPGGGAGGGAAGATGATGGAPPAGGTGATGGAGADPPAHADPKWLDQRLSQAKKNAEKDVLKALGVESVEAAKARIDAAKAAEDAGKTQAQKDADRIKALEPEAAKAAKRAETIARLAVGQMSLLTPERAAAVKAVAGDDPELQLDVIEKLKGAWEPAGAAGGTGATGASGATGATGATGTERPVNTAPPPGAPPGATGAPPPARAQYEALRSQNPFAAAAFGSLNPGVYEPPRR